MLETPKVNFFERLQKGLIKLDFFPLASSLNEASFSIHVLGCLSVSQVRAAITRSTSIDQMSWTGDTLWVHSTPVLLVVYSVQTWKMLKNEFSLIFFRLFIFSILKQTLWMMTRYISRSFDLLSATLTTNQR